MIKQLLFFKQLLKPTNPHDVLSLLYKLSEKTSLAIVVISMIMTIIFVPIIGTPLLYWGAVLIFIGTARIFVSRMFNQYKERYSMTFWYRLFTVLALSTAATLALLPLLTFPKVDDFHQLLVILVMVGAAAGATKTLALDMRIALAYFLIILFPVMLNSVEYHYLVDILLLVYIISQAILMFETNQMYKELASKESKLIDIQQTLHSQEKLLYDFLEEAPVPIFSYDRELNLVNYNPSFSKLFQRTEASEALNLNTLKNREVVMHLRDSLTNGAQHYNGIYQTIHGYSLWVDFVCFPFKDNQGNVLGGIGIIKDETKEHEALHKLEYIAVHDALTGLYNRTGYAEHIKQLVEDERHQNEYSLLIYIDLNRFKSINDSLGHDIGDKVLLEVSKRLRKELGSESVISRLGGDEFIVLVPYGALDKQTAQVHAKEKSEKIQNIFSKVFMIDNLCLHIQASIGILIIEPRYGNTEEILRHADIAMYDAKNSNRNIAYYDSKLDEKQKEFFALQNNLAYAVENEELILYFQPIVQMQSNEVVSAELLMRWKHPTKGILSPEIFIPLAINAGLLSEMTWWIIDRVCAQIAQWKQNGVWHLEYISININAQQLIEENFTTKLLALLKQYHLETKDIMIEITERSLIDNFESTKNIINSLKDEGIRCAIDDFGIGYSSLSYLKKLSFHTLKIDKAFIQDIESNPKEVLLVETILELGRHFDYRIVIEGIEKKIQKELLLELDANLKYQGFYFSKPVDADTFATRYLKGS